MTARELTFRILYAIFVGLVASLTVAALDANMTAVLCGFVVVVVGVAFTPFERP